jgi:hypothetical protein
MDDKSFSNAAHIPHGQNTNQLLLEVYRHEFNSG